jgi:hypothetical protein
MRTAINVVAGLQAETIRAARRGMDDHLRQLGTAPIVTRSAPSGGDRVRFDKWLGARVLRRVLRRRHRGRQARINDERVKLPCAASRRCRYDAAG